jgi:lipoprotein signal peptidase
MVGADAATKTAAFQLLPHGQPVTLLPGLRLYLAVNDWGVLGGVHGMGAVTERPAYTMLLAAGLVVLAGAVLALARTRWSFAKRVVVATVVFFAVAIGAEAGSVFFDGGTVPASTIVATIRAAVLILALSLYAASRARRSRAPMRLLAAGALANAASSAYPPYEVVDFLMVPLAPLSGWLAPRADLDATVGVVNLADLYLFAFPLLLASWPLAALATLLRERWRRRRRVAKTTSGPQPVREGTP